MQLQYNANFREVHTPDLPGVPHAAIAEFDQGTGYGIILWRPIPGSNRTAPYLMLIRKNAGVVFEAMSRHLDQVRAFYVLRDE